MLCRGQAGDQVISSPGSGAGVGRRAGSWGGRSQLPSGMGHLAWVSGASEVPRETCSLSYRPRV